MFRTIQKIIIVLPLMLAFGLTAAHAEGDMIIERASPLGYEETIAKLIENAKGLGWKVPKKWIRTFQKNFKRIAKVDIGRNQLIEMCQPHAAAKLLIHDKYKKFLSMMPCTVAVYEKSDGKVYLSMMNIQMMGQLYKGQKEIEEMVTELGPQMEKMLIME